MSRRRFFFVSLALAILAVGSQLVALQQFIRGRQLIARVVTSPTAEQAAAKLEARRHTSRGRIFQPAGWALALASTGFVAASARKREPAWRSLTISFLMFDVILHSLL